MDIASTCMCVRSANRTDDEDSGAEGSVQRRRHGMYDVESLGSGPGMRVARIHNLVSVFQCCVKTGE